MHQPIQLFELPRSFDESSILIFDRDDSFRRFSAGDAVPIEDIFDDDDPSTVHDVIAEKQKGLCLAGLGDHVWYTPDKVAGGYQDASEPGRPHQKVPRIIEGFWVAEYQNGRIVRQSDRSLHAILGDCTVDSIDEVEEVPIDALEAVTCLDRGRTPEYARRFMQFPGAYEELYRAGNFAGILNRSWCHLECGADIVWFKDDLCLMWIRLAPPDFDWIKICPFRIDRSGEPGRLLRRFAYRSPWMNLFRHPRYRRLPIKMYWSNR